MDPHDSTAKKHDRDQCGHDLALMVEGDVAAHGSPGDHHAEEEQNDDRPDVDEDQRQRHELGRKQEEHPGHRRRGSDQKQGGPDHVLGGDHPDRGVDQDQSQHDVDPVDRLRQPIARSS